MTQQPAEQGSTGLKRVLGPVDATCVVVGAIIGVGIFFTPSAVAGFAGSGTLAMWTWAIGGGIALLGALTFAELGGLYPRSGGQYDVLRDAWGTLPAFLFVFCNATAVQAGAIAIIAIVSAQHLGLVAGTSLGAIATTAIAGRQRCRGNRPHVLDCGPRDRYDVGDLRGGLRAVCPQRLSHPSPVRSAAAAGHGRGTAG